MTSQTKIESNRRNAEKSTGPKSVRGKSLSRQNALRSGVYARQRLLPGENGAAFQALLDDVIAQYKPVGPFEKMLVDQIAADMWRINRTDRAEHAYFEKIAEGQQSRMMRSLTEEEHNRLQDITRQEGGAKNGAKEHGVTVIYPNAQGMMVQRELPPEFNDEVTLELQKKIARWCHPDTTILAAMVPAHETNPLEATNRQKRALFRDLIRNLKILEDFRVRRLTLIIPAENPEHAATRSLLNERPALAAQILE